MKGRFNLPFFLVQERKEQTLEKQKIRIFLKPTPTLDLLSLNPPIEFDTAMCNWEEVRSLADFLWIYKFNNIFNTIKEITFVYSNSLIDFCLDYVKSKHPYIIFFKKKRIGKLFDKEFSETMTRLIQSDVKIIFEPY